MTAVECHPLTIPTAQAARIILQVAALLVAGKYGVLYVFSILLWLYWR
jgi:hypothetical protein